MINSDSITAFSMLDESPQPMPPPCRLDEIVLRARVERVLAIDKLGVQHHVALLRRLRFQVGEALPDLQSLVRTMPHCATAEEVSRRASWVFAFGAEEAVDIAVFMLHQAHVVDIRVGVAVSGSRTGSSRNESCPRRWGFRPRRKTTCGPRLDARHEQKLALMEQSAGVECGIDAHALEKQRIGFAVEIVAPEDGAWAAVRTGNS